MTEREWRLVWGCWLAAFVVAETVALRSKLAHAPLSHHMRHTLGARKETAHRRVGQTLYVSGVVWLAAHIWKKVNDG